MGEYNTKINYLFNSGFAVETGDYLFIFDYFKDKTSTLEKSISNGAVGEDDLKIDKKIFVFASHHHEDHYNPVIFNWRNIRPDINYILSSDIECGKKDDKIHVLSTYEELDIEGVHIKAYGSTDEGISFLIKIDETVIYHAGDLNWWHWSGDSKEENEKAEVWFKEEIERIKGQKIDISFFPVDPRLKDSYYIGAEYFINEICPKILIPMHFGRTYEITKKFSDKVKNLPVKAIEITHRGQEIIL